MAAKLSIDEVRALHLRAQGLSSVPQQSTSQDAKAVALAAIRRMKALQIDTISVVARSPYLVLWSRIGEYDPKVLDELLEEGRVFEYWAHAACFLPGEDYGFYRRWMVDGATLPHRYHSKWFAANRLVAEEVLARITAEGPLRSADFERTDGRKSSGWWDWKQEKVALEALFTLGELMVARRQNFQRVYDLRERVRPDWDDSVTPPIDEVLSRFVRESVEALGVAKPEWLTEYLLHQQPKRRTVAAVREAIASGELAEIEVEGWNGPGYALPGWVEENLPKVAQRMETPTTLLSPFDPVVWDRARLATLFGFDYRIECYTPAPKRKYGYFTLPILHNGAMVGRLDPKAHRKQGVMEIKSLHLEPDVVPDAELVDGLRGVIRRFAGWHGTPEVVVGKTVPANLKKALKRI